MRALVNDVQWIELIVVVLVDYLDNLEDKIKIVAPLK